MGQGTSIEEGVEMVHGRWNSAKTATHTSAHGRDTVTGMHKFATPIAATTAYTSEAWKKKRTDRMVLWEVSIARGCIDSFNKMLTAYAIVLSLLVTVNLMGFFQPPRGWAGDSGHMFPRSNSLIAFSLFNSASLYTATCGLLFYIYCCHSAIVSLQWVPLPHGPDDPDFSDDLLHNLRATLRRVTLPSVKRRCAYLFSFLACSLTCCMVAYICAGFAATNPGQLDRWIGVMLPAFPGCTVMLFVLHIAATKLRLELDFNTRFQRLWSNMGGAQINDPGIRVLHKEDLHALDPLPHVLRWWYHSQTGDEDLGTGPLLKGEQLA